jgi:hypothetical protein
LADLAEANAQVGEGPGEIGRVGIGRLGRQLPVKVCRFLRGRERFLALTDVA